MRWSVLRPLLHKEILRHLANRGGLGLVLLLLVASLLLSLFKGRQADQASLAPAIRLCYVDYAEDSPLVAHLKNNVPAELTDHVQFRPFRRVLTDSSGKMLYPTGTGAIQIRPPDRPGSAGTVWFWHPGDDRTVLAPYETWFWKETLRFVQSHSPATAAPTVASAPLVDASFTLTGGMDSRTGVGTALVLFGLFFVCVYLLPSLTCEERERGVLLAQALSPATTTELLAAKFLFYPVIGIALAALLASVQDPRVLLRAFFWLALLVSAVGSMGVGLTIASLARTQRGASLGAMCYLMAVSLLLFICQQNNIFGLPWLALEYHCPRMLHAALTGHVAWYHWFNLLGAGLLGVAWAVTAGVMFRRRGWQ